MNATSKKSLVSPALWEQCKSGVQFWGSALSKSQPPHIPLFVFKDQSLAVWGRDIFPKGKPFCIPLAAPGQVVLILVSDASSVGFAFYCGLPWQALGKGKIIVGLWSPEHSTWTSNVRESLVLVIAAKLIVARANSLKRVFIVFFGDNTCAVAIAVHLYSAAPAKSSSNTARRHGLTDEGRHYSRATPRKAGCVY